MQLVKDEWKRGLFLSSCLNEKQTPEFFFPYYNEMYEKLVNATEYFDDIHYVLLRDIPTLDMNIINSEEDTFVVMCETIHVLVWNLYVTNGWIQYGENGEPTEESDEDFDQDISSHHHFYVNDIMCDLEIYFEKMFFHHGVTEYVGGRYIVEIKNAPIVGVW